MHWLVTPSGQWPFFQHLVDRQATFKDSFCGRLSTLQLNSKDMIAPSKDILEAESKKKWPYIFYPSIVFAVVFGGLGIVALSVSLRNLNLIESLRENGSSATGRILEVRYTDPGYFCGKTCLAYTPLYEYNNSLGETRNCWGSWTGRNDTFIVGDTVELFYSGDGANCYDRYFVAKTNRDYLLGIIMLVTAALGMVGTVVSFRRTFQKK